ncbi:MAG: nucleotidyltransferase family protein [Deltaproteobacteria bacterium]|nr:nucleotidyltransferase family protein [Deltaproteobacteria bacterium]MBW2015021.1 nucleotidyltransferase family protein [Deltaproteobacteria bacterium]MBW2089565.1 nucleotidyltransferase family protein [Deltaproteobacteria bacterium]
MAKIPYEMPKDKIKAFCKRNKIRKLAVFGSILRQDFGPGSDIDLLVEFDPGNIPGLIRLAGMENELAEILGRKVDIRTAQDLSRYFRQDVIKSSEVQYAEG